MPAVYSARYFVASGALLSYGFDIAHTFWQAASYIECAIGDKVLWGIGIDANTTRASLKAVVSAVNRATR